MTVGSDSTGYGKEGEGTDPKDTPQSVTGSAVTHKEQPVTAPVTTVMAGPPVTAKDKDKIRNIYAMTQSKSETCRLVWGGKNGQRLAWLNEILQGSEVQQ